MKCNLLIICFLFAINVNTIAQFKQDYVWLVGNSVEDTTSSNGINIFDFNNNQLNITKQFEGFDLYLTNSSISNQAGELLFYSNGCSINNANLEQMQGGFNLNPGFAYDTGNCPDGGNSATNGLIILPKPGDSLLYYVFHLGLTATAGIGTHVNKLYFTIVDMSQNNGLGKVIDKNHVVLNDTLFGDLHAVRHANGEDWWLMVSKNHRNHFYKVLLTANGIADILEQDIGIDPNPFTSGGGQARFSPDGTKYARYHQRDQVTLFDFDRATGELSNFQHLYADTTEGFWGGLSFSSNSRFLYISTQFKLFQLDMLASDIQASKVLIDEWDGFTVGGFSVMFFLMQLAPDCKIYMIPVNGSKYMHVIEHPNEPGLACDFRQRGLVLPAINNTSLPNFPNYRLGTGYPVCDSTIVYVSATGGFVPPPMQEVRVWPNPAREQVSLSLSLPLSQGATFHLFDQLEREMKREAISAGQQQVEIGLAGVAPGLYFWSVEAEGRKLDTGKLVITH